MTYQVQISAGVAKGSYNMRTKREAEEFVAAWRKDSNDVDASAVIVKLAKRKLHKNFLNMLVA